MLYSTLFEFAAAELLQGAVGAVNGGVDGAVQEAFGRGLGEGVGGRGSGRPHFMDEIAGEGGADGAAGGAALGIFDQDGEGECGRRNAVEPAREADEPYLLAVRDPAALVAPDLAVIFRRAGLAADLHTRQPRLAGPGIEGVVS